MIHAILILVWIRVLALLPEMFSAKKDDPTHLIVMRVIAGIIILLALMGTLPSLFQTAEIPQFP